MAQYMHLSSKTGETFQSLIYDEKYGFGNILFWWNSSYATFVSWWHFINGINWYHVWKKVEVCNQCNITDCLVHFYLNLPGEYVSCYFVIRQKPLTLHVTTCFHSLTLIHWHNSVRMCLCWKALCDTNIMLTYCVVGLMNWFISMLNSSTVNITF